MNDSFRDLIIFEMANNHQGSVEHGRRIIEAVADIAGRHGIRAAIKFQYRDLDTFIHPESRARTDIAHVPRFLSTRLDDDQFESLMNSAAAHGLVRIVTPFDERSVDKCLAHGADILKVASCSATDWPLLEAVAGSGRPVIASTGGVGLEDIDNLVMFFEHRNVPFALMHCVSIYPTPDDSVQMNFLARMKRRYPGVAVGYSGHEAPANLDVVVAAIAKGADLLERHVGVATDTITLNAYSMDPVQAEAWVSQALRARTLCGSNDDKHVGAEEQASILSLARGVYARQHIAAGQTIRREDVYFAMPCTPGQTTSGEFGRLRAVFTASMDYAAHQAISETVPEDLTLAARSVLHEARGLLNEARIQCGNDVQYELSHHYGMARFREVGAVFVHVINREYCKKLGVMLPGQRHPVHRHKEKEETFQLLWGDLVVEREDETFHLQPGDQLLIARDTWHAFHSAHGAILEEVSTTDVRGGSEYRDAEINALDPMQRKTLLEAW